MSTMTAQPATTPIPVQLSESEFTAFIAAPTKFEAESIASETHRSVALDAP